MSTLSKRGGRRFGALRQWMARWLRSVGAAVVVPADPRIATFTSWNVADTFTSWNTASTVTSWNVPDTFRSYSA